VPADARDDARTRMLRSAAQLQRSTGVVGTGFSDIIAHSGAPRGSIYYHFPEGRTQLAAEATTFAAGEMADVIRAIMARGTLHDALDSFVGMWIAMMRDGNYHLGCAVAAAAVESRSAPGLRRAASDGFELWIGVLVDAMVDRGLEAAAARDLAVAILAGIEGAIILARASGGPEPLESIGRSLHLLIDLALTKGK
jgi:TetR/AcrR family transcriptional regulator, lmrAB and yxaGH operons repressor